MITFHGSVSHIPDAVIAAADTVKLLNYKTTTPRKFQKRNLTEDIAGSLMSELAEKIGVDQSRLDYVYFSAARGAEEHVDALDPKEFQDRTFIIPVILPPRQIRDLCGGCSDGSSTWWDLRIQSREGALDDSRGY